MKTWLPALVRTVVSLSILAAGVGGFFWMGTPEVPTEEPRREPPPLVETQPAAEHRGGISFDVDGVVVPYREIEIAAQVSGKVQYKSESCRSGRTVRKGEVLLRIEPDDYLLEIRRLKEELAQAKAMIAELDAEILSSENQIASSRQQLVIDSRQLQRSKDLMSRSAASDTEVDNARKAEIATQNTLQSLIDQKNLLTQRRIRMESAQALVQANLEKAQLDLKRTEIVSPIDGVVVSEGVEQDGYVQAGGPMILLQDTSQLDVTCKLYMRQMHWLWQSDSSGKSVGGFSGGYDFPETPATVVYSLGDQQYAWRGVVDRYDGAGLDRQTRMVPCRVNVSKPTEVSTLAEIEATRQSGELALVAMTESDAAANEPTEEVPQGKTPSRGAEIVGAPKERPMRDSSPPTLMTGMFVKVRIHATPPIPLVRLPQQAIQPGNMVWTVLDGKLNKKSVSVASSTADSVVAYQSSGGLQAGDLVVISPLATPVEGMPVRTAADVAKPEPGRGGPPGTRPPGTRQPLVTSAERDSAGNANVSAASKRGGPGQ